MQPIKYTEVFDDNAKAFLDGYRYIINQGSARSSKTYSILQLLHVIAKKDKKRIISVVSQTLPHLKRGAIRDFLDYLITTGQYRDDDWKVGSLTYLYNNSVIEFFSVDQPDKVYGAARDILFCNEVNCIKEESFRQLAIRTRETIFVDFNPTHEFYIHTDYKLRPNAKYIHSTFLKNPYLSKEIVRELIETGKRNPNFNRVFVDGEIGQAEGVILNNWRPGDFNDQLPFIYGMDFGSRHPDTLVKCAVDFKEKIIYWKEEIYQTGLSTEKLIEILKTRGIGNKLIIADCAAPRTIQDIRGSGFNIRPVVKGKVVDDIKVLWDYDIVVDQNSFNLQRNLNWWVWLDRKGEIPSDTDDDVIDAGRYAAMFLIKPRHSNPKFYIPKS